MTNIPYIDTAAIKTLYAPYHTMPAFEQGFTDYGHGTPYRHSFLGMDRQAYDRGQEAAMKIERIADWVKNNVGGN